MKKTGYLYLLLGGVILSSLLLESKHIRIMQLNEMVLGYLILHLFLGVASLYMAWIYIND